MYKKLTGFINSTGFKIILLVILLLVGYRTFLSMRQVSRLEEDISALQEKISLVEEENTQLKERIKKVDDPEYIERVARKELGLVKPGELLLVPVDEANKDKQGTERDRPTDKTADDEGEEH